MSTPFVAPRAGPESVRADRSSKRYAPKEGGRALRLVEGRGDDVASSISETASSEATVSVRSGPAAETVERVRASRAEQGLALGVEDPALIAALRNTLQPAANARTGRRCTY